MNFLDKRDLGKNDGAGWVVDSRDTTSGACVMGTEAIGTEDRTPRAGGNVIAFSPGASGVVRDSARELAKILNKLNITTRIALDTRVESVAEGSELGSPWKLANEYPTRVVLFVGPNPLFRLTDAKKRPK